MRASTLFSPAADVMLFPGYEYLACVEDRGIRSADDADEQRQDEGSCRFAAKQKERQQRKHDCERGVHRPNNRLRKTVVDDAFEGRVSLLRKILANAVEHYDRVVHREPDHCQDGGHEQGIDLDVEEPTQDREDTDHEKNIMEHADDGRSPVAQRLLRISERKRDVHEDTDRGHRNRED